MNKKLAYMLMGSCFAIVAIRPTQSVQRSAGTVFQTAPATPAERFDTYTKVGARVPQFTVTTLDGKRFSSTEVKGKILVLNLWATWCAPCRVEMPRLEREIWKNSNPNDFAMVAIAREETNEQITAFRKANGFTFPMAADPDRSIFQLFASGGIPRTYVIGRDGTILYQSLGYKEAEFDKLKSVVETELKKSQM
jgi:peroxiredoxin